MRAIITTLLLALAAGSTQAADSWTGQDKGKHLAVGAMITGSAMHLGDTRLALLAGASAAIGKELVDMHRPGHVPSYRDAAVTMAGALLAAQTPGLIITPFSVSYRLTW